jgi:hypothetical protein
MPSHALVGTTALWKHAASKTHAALCSCMHSQLQLHRTADSTLACATLRGVVHSTSSAFRHGGNRASSCLWDAGGILTCAASATFAKLAVICSSSEGRQLQVVCCWAIASQLASQEVHCTKDHPLSTLPGTQRALPTKAIWCSLDGTTRSMTA